MDNPHPVRWKFTLEFEGEDGHTSKVEIGGEHVRDPEDDEFEPEPMAMDLAAAFIALNDLGGMVPRNGEDVVEAFRETFEQGWPMWRDDDGSPDDDGFEFSDVDVEQN